MSLFVLCFSSIPVFGERVDIWIASQNCEFILEKRKCAQIVNDCFANENGPYNSFCQKIGVGNPNSAVTNRHKKIRGKETEGATVDEVDEFAGTSGEDLTNSGGSNPQEPQPQNEVVNDISCPIPSGRVTKEESDDYEACKRLKEGLANNTNTHYKHCQGGSVDGIEVANCAQFKSFYENCLEESGSSTRNPSKDVSNSCATTAKIEVNRCADTNDASCNSFGNDTGESVAEGFKSASYVDERIKECKSKAKEAKQCCNNPLSCFEATKDSKITTQDVQTVSTLMTVIGQLNGNGSVADACKQAKTTNSIGALANSAMSATCIFEKRKCDSECETAEVELEQLIAACSGPSAAVKQTCYGAAGMMAKYKAALKEVKRETSSCLRLNGKAGELAVAAVSQAAAAKLAAECEEQASAASPDLLGDTPLGAPDCSDPANASNPFCLNCQKAGSENNPICQQINSASKVTSGSGSLSAYDGANQYGTSGAGGNSDFDTADTGQGQNQMPVGFGDGNSSNKTAGVGAGGGGVPNSGGGGFGSGGSGGGRRGPGKSRYNTNTLHGVSGGGGYSVSSMGFKSGGGGFRGYGNGNNRGRGGSKKGLKGFDIKKYLPGRSAPRRAPAGLASERPDISAVSANIFEKISHRYIKICRQGRFLEQCPYAKPVRIRGLKTPN